MLLALTACGSKVNESNKKSVAEEIENESANYFKEAKGPFPQLTTEVAKNEKLVEMETSMGTVKIKLFPEYAPKAVENFIKLSEKGYYDGVIFHRVIPDFMIQGGDPDGTGMGGESIFGKPFVDEFSNKLYNLRGALSMANTGMPSTNGSQFFIVQNKSVDANAIGTMEQKHYAKEIIDAYEKNGGTPWLDHHHTVFGQVIDGMDVVDKIASVKTGANDKPVEDVIIKKINVVK